MIRILFSFTVDVFKFIIEAATFAFSLIIPRRDHDYHAAFGSGYPVLSVFNEGPNISGKKYLSKEFATRHTIIFGPSGSGKSTVVFYNALLGRLDKNASYIINDPSKELWKCAAHLKSQGVEPLILDFSSANSIGFNVLAKISDEQGISKLASMIIRTSLGTKEPFWNAAAQDMLVMCIALALKLEPSHRNLANAKRLVQMIGSSQERIKSLMVKHATDKTFNAFKNILGYDAKLQKNIVATVNSALTLFDSDDVARVTSTDSLAFPELRKRRIALFIQNKITDTKHYNTLISIFFESLFSALMSEPVKPQDKTVYFYIDEAASGLYMPSFSNVLANSRKMRMPFVLGVQEQNQLVDTYNKEIANSIITNCYNKLYMTGMGLEAANMLEQMLGKYTYVEGRAKKIRSLMTASEIRQMPSDRGIFIAGNHKPVYLKLRPFYTISKHLRRAQLPLHAFKAPPLPPVTYIK